MDYLKTDRFIIAGPCSIESEEICNIIADKLKELSIKYNIHFIFKASFDKANRLSIKSYRGLGIDNGLKILENIKNKYELPILTDIHESYQADLVKNIVDIIQIPAFLCRQTDLIIAARDTGKWINIKKGQFISPVDIYYSLEKAGNKSMVTERGSCYGYDNLIVDVAGICKMREYNKPIIFDACHSLKNNIKYAFDISCALYHIGVTGLYFELHPYPERALCDAKSSIRLDLFERNIMKLIKHYKEGL